MEEAKKVWDKWIFIVYTICVMEELTKDDLTQMGRVYFQSLKNEILIDVACRLRNFSVELVERLEQNSSNSSKPPSSDSPYEKGRKENTGSGNSDNKRASEEVTEKESPQSAQSGESTDPDDTKRSPGRQPGSQGFWRSETPTPECTIPHYPEHCIVCGEELHIPESSKPYMGYYVFELEKIGDSHILYPPSLLCLGVQLRT
jgi:hypothetical protein